MSGEAFQVGLRIGKYELTRKLGEGGFGVLFVARDTSLDRELAIKFLHPHHSSNTDVVKRFVQEARSIAQIVHPGIVTVYESGEVSGTGTPADGAAYIMMELLKGETLTQRLKNSGGRLSPSAAMEICRQVASALEAAHRKGVVHRDLKPDNIMLVKDLALNLGERAKVLDFGIAKMATAAPSGATQAGMVFGTPNYMAPEQCKSAADANHSSDIYSLGCILFELVTGRPPFEGAMAELIAHHILTPPPVPSHLVPGLPSHIDDVVAAMLAKAPANRPASMTVVERILEERRLTSASSAGGGGGRTRTLGGARLATSPPALSGQPSNLGAKTVVAAQRPDFAPPPLAPGSAAPAPAVSTPTTLNSAAGIAANLERRSSPKWWIAIPIVVVAAVGTVLAINRGGDDASTTESPPPGSDSIATTGNTTPTTGSATPATGRAAITTGSAGITTGSAAITTGSAATGSTATGSAATGSVSTGTGSGSTAGSATATKAGTDATSGSAATTTTLKAGSAAITTKVTGTTGGSASKPPHKTPQKPPEPAQGSASKKCQGRSCILDGNF